MPRARPRAGPTVEVHDPEAGLDLDDRRLVRVLGAGEHVAPDAGAGEGRRERPHVHVHPAAVARTRLRERRRVHAEHRDPADRHGPTDPTCAAQGPLTVGRGSVRPSDRSRPSSRTTRAARPARNDRLVEVDAPASVAADARDSAPRSPERCWPRRDRRAADDRSPRGDATRRPRSTVPGRSSATDAVAAARLGSGPGPRAGPAVHRCSRDEPVVAVPRPSGEVLASRGSASTWSAFGVGLSGRQTAASPSIVARKAKSSAPAGRHRTSSSASCSTVSRPRCGPPRPVAAGRAVDVDHRLLVALADGRVAQDLGRRGRARRRRGRRGCRRARERSRAEIGQRPPVDSACRMSTRACARPRRTNLGLELGAFVIPASLVSCAVESRRGRRWSRMNSPRSMRRC